MDRGQGVKTTPCIDMMKTHTRVFLKPTPPSTRIMRKERTLLPLSLTEALFIEKQSPGTTLNAKEERGRGGLVRLRANRE